MWCPKSQISFKKIIPKMNSSHKVLHGLKFCEDILIQFCSCFQEEKGLQAFEKTHQALKNLIVLKNNLSIQNIFQRINKIIAVYI